MAENKTFHGARAILKINGTVAGIFNNVSYGLRYTQETVYTLGNHAPKEIVLTSQEPVSVSASGFRVINAGPHKEYGADAKKLVPTLSDLLGDVEIELTIVDRQNADQVLMHVGRATPVGFSSGMTARSLTEMSVDFVGITMETDGLAMSEAPGAPSYP
jgi:hypothetical protein